MPAPVASRSLGLLWGVSALVMIGVAVWTLSFHLRLPSNLPEESHYRAVAEVWAQEAKPGDAVLLFPWWAERARLFAPEGLPVIGHLRSDHADLKKHPRIWVLSQPDLPRTNQSEFEDGFLPARTRVGEPRHFGPLSLTLYENGRHAPVVFDAAAALARANAYIEQPGGARTPCVQRGEGFQCPGGAHLYIRREWREVLYEPRHCLYLHPPGGAARLVLEWPAATLGEEAVLEAGYIWDRHAFKAAHHTTAYVTLENAQTRERLAEVALPPGLGGVQRASVKTTGEAPLALSVRAANAADRWLCVDFTAFGRRSP